MVGAVILTQEQLEELLVYWRRVLRLQDWDVKVRLVRRDGLFGLSGDGGCRWELAAKQAQISVLDPIDYPETLWPQDMERTLVHELLHLHFAPFVADDDTPEDIAQEQAIACLANALVSLKRRDEADR